MCYEQREWHSTSLEREMSEQMGEAEQGRKQGLRGAQSAHSPSARQGVSQAAKSNPALLSGVPSFDLCWFCCHLLKLFPEYSFTESWESGVGSRDVSLAVN